MQLFRVRTSCAAGISRRASPTVGRPAAAQRVRMQRVVTWAADTEAATETEDASSSADAQAQDATPSPLERARIALAAESIDKAELEAALAELESEMGRIQGSVTEAEARAATAEGAVATSKDQLLRLSADFDNFRRRTKEEKEALQDSVRGDIVVSLLPVVDNFELARTQVKAETEGEIKINNSYQSLYKQFVDFLRTLGVEAVPTTGTPFDPMVHEAIMREASDEHPDGTVLMEFRKGFRIGEKLLRPAMVKVSVNDNPGPSASSGESDSS